MRPMALLAHLPLLLTLLPAFLPSVLAVLALN